MGKSCPRLVALRGGPVSLVRSTDGSVWSFPRPFLSCFTVIGLSFQYCIFGLPFLNTSPTQSPCQLAIDSFKVYIHIYTYICRNLSTGLKLSENREHVYGRFRPSRTLVVIQRYQSVVCFWQPARCGCS